MIRLRRPALLFAALVVCAPASLANAGAVFAAGTAVSGIIEQLKTAIQQVLDQLDNRVSARSFQIRTELVFLQGELANSAGALVGKTFGELGKAQQVFFENATSTVANARVVAADTTKELGTIVTQVEQLVAQFPFVGEEPRVRRSTPAFIRRAQPGDSPVTIGIEGSFLRHGDSTLRIGSTQCMKLTHIESQIAFSCPAALFAATSEKVGFVKAELLVDNKRGLLERVTSIFSKASSQKRYDLAVAVVPPVLGTYAVSVSHLADDARTVPRNGVWGRTNDHCVGTPHYFYNFGPTGPGWRIDISSIQISVGCTRGGGGHAIRNASEAGFQIESWSSNSGNCERLMGRVVARDARGCHSGTVKWSDVQVAAARKDSPAGAGQLEWGKSVAIPLPPRTEGFVVTVKQIDGQTVSLNSAIPSRWFTVTRDAANTSLVLSPLELARALAN